jgi:3-hydroxyisobutyrate dehydrogenase
VVHCGADGIEAGAAPPGQPRLTVMVGANDDGASERIHPLLESMSENIFSRSSTLCGPRGEDDEQLCVECRLVAALDALAVGARYGVSPERMFEVFNASTARNFLTADRLRQEALTCRFATGFQLGLFVKDLGIANDLTDELQLVTRARVAPAHGRRTREPGV